MEIKESIIDHSKHPHNFGEIKDATFVIEEGNQSCGDMVKLYLTVDSGVIKDVKFKGLGCAVSIASSSLVTDYIKGKTVAEAKTLTPETVFDLLGTTVSTGRLRCALLPLQALKKL